jgi:ankyrin repeat protein
MLAKSTKRRWEVGAGLALAASLCLAGWAAYQKCADVALSRALSSNDASAVRWWVRRGANVNTQIARPDGEISPLLTNRTCLELALARRDLTFARELLQRGADPSALDGEALFQACHSRTWALIPDLLSYGADANSKGGRSLLLMAILRRRADTVGLLLARGADPNAVLGFESTDPTALQIARKHGGPAVVRLLKQAGAKR